MSNQFLNSHFVAKIVHRKFAETISTKFPKKLTKNFMALLKSQEIVKSIPKEISDKD